MRGRFGDAEMPAGHVSWGLHDLRLTETWTQSDECDIRHPNQAS